MQLSNGKKLPNGSIMQSENIEINAQNTENPVGGVGLTATSLGENSSTGDESQTTSSESRTAIASKPGPEDLSRICPQHLDSERCVSIAEECKGANGDDSQKTRDAHALCTYLGTRHDPECKKMENVTSLGEIAWREGWRLLCFPLGSPRRFSRNFTRKRSTKM